MMGGSKTTCRIVVYVVATILIISLIAVIIHLLRNKDPAPKTPRGAVVTNGYGCASIGAAILEKGGNAVEAAIASLFCEGVSMPQSMGLGGGFLMTIYKKDTKSITTLNSRERAPGAAHKDMFTNESSTNGALAAAIPGELVGYHEAYSRFGGTIPWRDLVQPTIDLCKNGILVTEFLAQVLQEEEQLIKHDLGLSEAFLDPQTKMPLKQNQFIKRLRLAKTLEVIADEGGYAIHNGSFTKSLVEDVNNAGGIFKVEDLVNFKPQWAEPIKIALPFNQTLYTTPLPGSGIVLGFIMNILNGFLDRNKPLEIRNWQRIVESFKHAYGRKTHLGDIEFESIEILDDLTSIEYANKIRQLIWDNITYQDPAFYGAVSAPPEDHGTAHISVLAPNGDAVSVTSTINKYYGCGFMSQSTGIILNNEMDDFSLPDRKGVPPNKPNLIKPGKRPMSSMVPSIILNEDGSVRLIIGAAGGTKITTSVAQVLIKHLWFNYTIQEAVFDRRLHHQVFPMSIDFEEQYEKDPIFISSLHDIGHEYVIKYATGFSAVTAISQIDGHIDFTTDVRRQGEKVYVY